MNVEMKNQQAIALDITVLHHPRAARSHISEPTVLWAPDLGYYVGTLYEEFDSAETRVYARQYTQETGHTPSIELIEQTLSDMIDGKPVPEELRMRA